jgi:hypothetical protein
MPKSYNFHTIISQLSNCVSTLSPAAINSFNLLYRSGVEGVDTSKNVKPEESGDEINVISIANILNSTNNPLIRAKKIIEFIDKIFVAVEKATGEFKNFTRSDEMKKKFEGWCEDHLKTCIEGCLLLKEALDSGVFHSGGGAGKKVKEEKVARRMVDFFLGWRENREYCSVPAIVWWNTHCSNCGLYYAIHDVGMAEKYVYGTKEEGKCNCICADIFRKDDDCIRLYYCIFDE